MTVLDAAVDWCLDAARRPGLKLLVDSVPDVNDFRWTNRDKFWYAEKDGFVSYYCWTPPDNNGGFGGSRVTITKDDGQRVTLLGPWSSSSSTMNAEGFGPCLDMAWTDSDFGFMAGLVFRHGAITLDLAKDVVARFLPGVKLVRVDGPGSIVYCPTMAGKTVEESKEWLKRSQS